MAGVVAYACNPNIRRLRQEDWELEASLGQPQQHSEALSQRKIPTVTKPRRSRE
jgi:hypothetical protein